MGHGMEKRWEERNVSHTVPSQATIATAKLGK
jgi:hypothetical protein